MVDRRGCLSAMELEVVAEALQRAVVWNKAAKKEFNEADETRRNRILAVISLWCEGVRLTPEQFNPNEGRAQKGSINRLVSAFKTHKVRLYGFERRLIGKRCFIAVSCDPQKKSDRGKVRVLDATKARVIDLEEQFGGRYED